MVRFFVRMAIFLGSAALGLLVAAWPAAVLTHGLNIRGIGSWVGATVVLPALFLKKKDTSK